MLNTDAEGRLILADGLRLASEAEPDAIVDLATLTGAVEVALGSRGRRADGQRRRLASTRSQAAADRPASGCGSCRCVEDYRPHLDSDVADLKNIGKPRQAGTITAGLFLREFVGEGIPWAHLDIAGTAWSRRRRRRVRQGRHRLRRAPAARAGPQLHPPQARRTAEPGRRGTPPVVAGIARGRATAGRSTICAGSVKRHPASGCADELPCFDVQRRVDWGLR